MAFTQITSDRFSRANVAAPGGSNTTQIGVPDSVFPPATAGTQYIDANGVWQISGNTLSAPSSFGADTNIYLHGMLYFPYVADRQQFSIITERVAGQAYAMGIEVHEAPGGGEGFQGYIITLENSRIEWGFHNGSAIAYEGSANYPASADSGTSTDGSGNIIPGVRIITSVSVVPSGANDSIVVSLASQATGIPFFTHTINMTDGAPYTFPGVYGISAPSSTGSAAVLIHGIDLYTDSDSNLNANATTLQTGSNHNGITLTGNGTNWLTSRPTFALSGATGVTQTSGTSIAYISDTEATIYVDVSGGGSGTLTITDPSQSAPNTATISIIAPSGSTPICGRIEARNAVGATDVALYIPPATGGLAPYTDRIWMGSTSTFAGGDAGTVDVTSHFNPTTRLLAYTPPDGKPYCFRAYATDSAVTPQTGHSQAMLMVAGYKAPSNPAVVASPKFVPKIAMVGDSYINYDEGGGSGATIFVESGTLIAAAITGATIPANLGVGGTSPADWMPGGGNYAALVSAANAASCNLITIYLSYNAATAGMSSATWQTDMAAIVAGLATDCPGCKVMLQGGSFDGADGPRNDSYLGYAAANAALLAANVHGNLVPGDLYSTVWLAANPNNLDNSVHPDAIARIAIAQYQMAAVAALVSPPVVTAVTNLRTAIIAAIGMYAAGGLLSLLSNATFGKVLSEGGNNYLIFAVDNITPIARVQAFANSDGSFTVTNVTALAPYSAIAPTGTNAALGTALASAIAAYVSGGLLGALVAGHFGNVAGQGANRYVVFAYDNITPIALVTAYSTDNGPLVVVDVAHL